MNKHLIYYHQRSTYITEKGNFIECQGKEERQREDEGVKSETIELSEL